PSSRRPRRLNSSANNNGNGRCPGPSPGQRPSPPGSELPVRDRLENLDRGGAAVGHGVGRGFADLLAGDSAAKRGARGVDVDRRPALLARGQQEGDLVVVAIEADG